MRRCIFKQLKREKKPNMHDENLSKNWLIRLKRLSKTVIYINYARQGFTKVYIVFIINCDCILNLAHNSNRIPNVFQPIGLKIKVTRANQINIRLSRDI